MSRHIVSTFLGISLTCNGLLIFRLLSKGREMDSNEIVSALGALAQEHRLALFRLLVQAGEQGMPAGAIAGALGVPNSTLSFHLGSLSKAGLIRQERQSRSLIYSADYAKMNELVGYLMENCCGGSDCTSSVSSAPQARERKRA
jgi:DNA-binding transcriptional ArsR family regulator